LCERLAGHGEKQATRPLTTFILLGKSDDTIRVRAAHQNKAARLGSSALRNLLSQHINIVV
jgi:hypothetical protein